MPSFPFFRPPAYYNSYRNPYYCNPQYGFTSNKGPDTSSHSSYENADRQDTYKKEDTDFNSHVSSNEQFFDIFGIRLYFDDILILCLLFFLYQEDVTDQLLFMALLLLLMS